MHYPDTQTTSLQVGILPALMHYPDTQTSLLHHHPACLAEKQQIAILVFYLTQSELQPAIYHTRSEHTNHYATGLLHF